MSNVSSAETRRGPIHPKLVSPPLCQTTRVMCDVESQQTLLLRGFSLNRVDQPINGSFSRSVTRACARQPKRTHSHGGVVTRRCPAFRKIPVFPKQPSHADLHKQTPCRGRHDLSWPDDGESGRWRAQSAYQSLHDSCIKRQLI